MFCFINLNLALPFLYKYFRLILYDCEVIKKENNYAFVDGQNLYIGTKHENWSINYGRLSIYLKDKYKVTKIFYFWGYYREENKSVYKKLANLDFIQIFKEHVQNQKSIKKGNVDSNLVFEIMKKINSKESFDKIVLISGDGDYKKLVYHLLQKHKLKKILFPSEKSTSFLYKKLMYQYTDCLSKNKVRTKIQIDK